MGLCGLKACNSWGVGRGGWGGGEGARICIFTVTLNGFPQGLGKIPTPRKYVFQWFFCGAKIEQFSFDCGKYSVACVWFGFVLVLQPHA